MGNIRKMTDWIRKELKWQSFVFLSVGGIINAVGIALFMNPIGLIDGGISGTAMLISRLVPKVFGIHTLSLLLIILNFPFFTIGMKKQGLAFSIYSRYAIIIYSVSAWIITHWVPLDLSTSPLAQNDIFLCTVFGGVILGAGRGLTIRFGGALDGIEAMAVIFAKKMGISVGTFVMLYNVVIYVLSGFVTGSWRLPLYSIVAYAVSLKTVDFFIEGIDRSKAVMIITDKPTEISSALSDEFGSGGTLMSAKGGYSNAEKAIIYFVVNRFQISKLKNTVQSIDPAAYMTVSDVADVIKMGTK